MIKGLTDRGMSFPEIGSIRKGGAKDPAKNQPGKDLTYFRIDIDAEEEKRHGTLTKFVALYGETPAAITIILPFDEIDRVWDAWREKYVAGTMIHRCDGENVKYAINPSTGERVVVNGLRVDNGQPQPCQIQHLPKPQCCIPVGRLKVIIPALNRLAYFVAHTTSIHDIINISEQLEAIRGLNGGHIAGVPLVLKRTPHAISTPSGENGKRARRVKHLISIEADPTWVEQKVLALHSAAMPQLTTHKPLELTSAGPDLAELEELEDEAEEELTGEFAEPEAPDETDAPLSDVPKPEPEHKAEAPKKQFKRASLKFNGMTIEQWHLQADLFATHNPHWQKNGQTDLDHITISAGYAGFEYISGDNIDAVFAAIVAAHEAKA